MIKGTIPEFIKLMLKSIVTLISIILVTGIIVGCCYYLLVIVSWLYQISGATHATSLTGVQLFVGFVILIVIMNAVKTNWKKARLNAFRKRNVIH